MIDPKLIQKPQRYIGNETNVIKKNIDSKIRICLSYPDLYEIGMSNLGLRIIYGLLNEYSNVFCERVFMPGDDLADYLRNNNTRLFSLETKTSLSEFDVLGFNLSYELNFTNFLNILSLGGVAIKHKDREKVIVLAGGLVNPEPVAEFVDVFFLGEFEEAAADFVRILQQYSDKEERLCALSEIDGFYVPKYYKVTLENNRYNFEKIYPYAKFPLKKINVKNLDSVYYPSRWLTPHTQIVHDRIPIEIARGCPNRCVFCQARAVYYPYREKKIETVMNSLIVNYESSGYEEVSFLSLSASDYSGIERLVGEAIDYLKDKQVGLTLPSLRIDDVISRLYPMLSFIKNTSLTVAVEAARDCLRNTLNKKIDINRLFEAANIIRSLNMRHIKVYFMFGFPGENDDDLIAIGKFLDNLSRQCKMAVNASINIFIPKPFSTWERQNMEREDVLAQKKEIIIKNIPRRHNIKVNISFTQKSILEAVIARADRKFSSVIYNAYLKGSRFDGYGEKFSWDVWSEAMKECGIDYRFYLENNLENTPWSFISTD